jgi:hypothetical protein
VIVAPVSRWGVLPIPATFQQPRLAPAAALAPAGSAPAGRAAPSALTGLMGPAVPLGLGLTGAFPLTLLPLRLRRRLAGTLRRGRLGHGQPGRGRPGPG